MLAAWRSLRVCNYMCACMRPRNALRYHLLVQNTDSCHLQIPLHELVNRVLRNGFWDKKGGGMAAKKAGYRQKVCIHSLFAMPTGLRSAREEAVLADLSKILLGSCSYDHAR